MTPDFSCERCQDSLPWYVANSLSYDDQGAMERHLAFCGRCRSALEEWRAVAMALHRADAIIPTASPTTWAHISRRLREQPTSTAKSNGRNIMRLQDRTLRNTEPPTDLPPAVPLHGRRYAIGGVVAVAALIALSASIFSYFATYSASNPGAVTATPHSACAPSQATANLPAHITLGAIAPLGTDDGWAVGGIADPQQPQLPPSAVMLRLRNCQWAPVGAPIPHTGLQDISMVTADEGWAVGVTYAQRVTLSDGTKVWDYDQPLVLHYTHGSWQTVKVTAGPKTSAEQVKMVSANEGWMLLYDGKHPTTVNGANTLTYGYSLRHYQNRTWADIPLGFLKPSMAVTDIDAREPGDIWLVGIDTTVINNSQSGFAAHYSNGVWTSYAGTALGADRPWFQSVSELSPADVWASGGFGLYHFDGAHWSKASIQGTISGVASTFMPPISQIAMLSPSQGWAFLSYGESSSVEALLGKALHYDHGVWQWTTLQINRATAPLTISHFSPSSPTQGWAIAFQVVNGYPQYVLLYFDAGVWGVVRPQS